MSTTGNIIEATVNADGTATVVIEDQTSNFTAANEDEARTKILALVIAHAVSQGVPVRALMTDTQGTWPVKVHPDGTVDPDTENTSRMVQEEPAESTVIPTLKRKNTPVESTAAPETKESTLSIEPAHGTETAAKSSSSSTPPTQKLSTGEKLVNPFVQKSPIGTDHSTEETAPSTSPGTRREARQSFLIKEQIEEPASKGWRGSFTRLGIRMAPSKDERAERAVIHAVSQHWPGPRTIAIVNGKGGASKTPTTVLLSAIFARYGGAGVLSWDNNQTRGTLGWRTEQGPHEATLLDLLPQAEKLLGTGAQSADLAHFVHHQTRDKFDVLRSMPMALASAQRVHAEDVDAIHQVASKYYRLIFIDSGNDESDPMWRRMIDHTDQLVVATTTRDDHAEAGALLLEALADRDERSAHLAEQAVVIVNQADPKATATDLGRVATGYRDLAREAITIPHDPAMVDGVLRYDALRPSTQRAWLAAGAAVARGL